MPLTLRRLLTNGYLPKELPPAFTSRSYGAAMRASQPAFVASKKSSMCHHNLARPGMLMRVLGIPNPVSFYQLAAEFIKGWPAIEKAIAASNYTISTPQATSGNARALVPSGRNEISDARARFRASSRFVALADVSQWYGSIYSHSIAWALHGKTFSKSNRKAKTLGNALDSRITACQDSQSVGLPVGPDTSFALGELVLGACDKELASALTGTSVTGFRYYDDYELYADTRQDAELAEAALQRTLATYQLALNPYKHHVEELPLQVEDAWVSAVKRVPVRNAVASERSDLLLMFDEAYRLSRVHRTQPVLKYALGRFVTSDLEWRQRISATNWPLFQRLLLQACLAEPGTLEKATYLLAWERRQGRDVDVPQLTEALNLLIGEQAQRGHASEVAWGLFAALRLGVKIRDSVALLVTKMPDDVVALVALDARDKGAFSARLDTSMWETWMTRASLYGEHWLTAFEAYEHGWIVPSQDYIASDVAFLHLRSNGVRFYNERRQLRPKPGAAPRPQRMPVAPTAAVLATLDEEVEEEEEAGEPGWSLY